MTDPGDLTDEQTCHRVVSEGMITMSDEVTLVRNKLSLQDIITVKGTRTKLMDLDPEVSLQLPVQGHDSMLGIIRIMIADRQSEASGKLDLGDHHAVLRMIQ